MKIKYSRVPKQKQLCDSRKRSIQQWRWLHKPSYTNIIRENQTLPLTRLSIQMANTAGNSAQRAKLVKFSQILGRGAQRVPAPHSPCPASPDPPGPPPCLPSRRSGRESHCHFSDWDHLWGGGGRSKQEVRTESHKGCSQSH